MAKLSAEHEGSLVPAFLTSPLTSLTNTVRFRTIPSRFSKSRDVGPYLGLVPKKDKSGNIDRTLGITKAGNSHQRRLLVGAAQYILGPFGKPCDLRRYGERIAGNGKNKIRKRKAVIAVARKLAVLLHHLWKTGDK